MYERLARILTPETREQPRQEQRDPEKHEPGDHEADREPEAALEIAELDIEDEGEQADATGKGVAGAASVHGYRERDAGQDAAEDFEWQVTVLRRDEGSDDRHRRAGERQHLRCPQHILPPA